MLNIAINLSDEFELTSLSRVNGDFVILSGRDQISLMTNDGSAITLMSFEDETEFSSLIPAMDGTIGTSRVGKTIFIESAAIEFSLWIFLTECTVLKKFLSGICWVPELKRSSSNSNKSQIVLFLRPLNINNLISTSRDRYNSFLLIDVENAHVMVVTLIYNSNISATW